MNINDLARDIIKKEDAELAKAFTMIVGGLLLQNGIQPILNKSIVACDENDDVNKYIIRREYNVTFDIDTSEHDAEVKKNAVDEFAEKLKKYICKENCGERQCIDSADRCVWYWYIDELLKEYEVEE